eukprot:m.6436 g.6436  ORF g.6436 m.6436 type:complete len:932 (+) comp15866_c0_seq2:89-2884(+)
MAVGVSWCVYGLVLLAALFICAGKRLSASYELSWNGSNVKLSNSTANLKDTEKLNDSVFGRHCLNNSTYEVTWFGGRQSSKLLTVNFTFNGTKRLSAVTINTLSQSIKNFRIFNNVNVSLYDNGHLREKIELTYSDGTEDCRIKDFTIPLLGANADQAKMDFEFPTLRFALGEILFDGEDSCDANFQAFSYKDSSTFLCTAGLHANTSGCFQSCCNQSLDDNVTTDYTCLATNLTTQNTSGLVLKSSECGLMVDCSFVIDISSWNQGDLALNMTDSKTFHYGGVTYKSQTNISIYKCSLVHVFPAPSTPSKAVAGLSGGAVAGIVIVVLLLLAAVILLFLFFWWRKRNAPSGTVEVVKYSQTNGPDSESPYDDPVECRPPILCTVNGDGQNGGENDYADVALTPTENAPLDTFPPPKVSRFLTGQVAEVPQYAEADKAGIPSRKALSMPAKSRVAIAGKAHRKKTMPIRLPDIKREPSPRAFDGEEAIYSTPGEADFNLTNTSPPLPPKPASVSSIPHQSDDSGVESPQSNPVYATVDEKSATVPRYDRYKTPRVVNLAIYASVEAIKRHSILFAEQTKIEHEEDLTPEFLLDASLSSESPLSPGAAGSILPYQSVYADPAPLLQGEGPMELPPEKFTRDKLIGQGQFGEVYQATAHQLLVEDFTEGRSNGLCVRDTHVALKYLHKGATKDMQEAFNKEVKFMAPLQHEHVVRLLGVCSASKPRFMVIEYMENGDLNQYLQHFTHSKMTATETETAAKGKPITCRVLLTMVVQIASAMEYLASKFFIHRDLATRNCLVGPKHIVKVADFGMTRSVYEKNYYRLAGRAILPIRWMAPETFYGKFTIMTDVWSFGVTCWEIFTLARCQPYHELSDKDVIENAVRCEGRIVLERPVVCDDETYGLMLQCWGQQPERRPPFTELHNKLREMADEA